MKTEYTGSVYLGVVGAITENSECRTSVNKIQLRMGDIGVQSWRGTKGFEGRQNHIDKFYDETDCSFAFLMDADMVFPPDCLERLRSHKLPFISGLYMRRRYSPIFPIWFTPPGPGEITVKPWVTIPERGRLHELGASGWGCMLIHRNVIRDVRKILKGEKDIIEDDMDLWPYDLQAVMAAIHDLKKLSDKDTFQLNHEFFRDRLAILEREIRPLRGCKNVIVGSDIRYPFYARAAGYKLYGDPDVRCGHMVDYPISPDDFENGMSATNIAELLEKANAEFLEEEGQIKEALKCL
jgi:hypothetical protein